MTIAQVSDKGQVTIPAALRREARISAGTRLSVEWRDGELVLRPLASFAAMAGALRKYARPGADYQAVREQALAAAAAEIVDENAR